MKKICAALTFIFVSFILAFAFEPNPVDAFAYYPKATHTLGSAVNSVDWSSDDSYFVVTDSQYFFAAKTINPNELDLAESNEGDIIFMKIAQKTEDSKEQIFALTSSNNISVRTFPFPENYPSRHVNENLKVRSVDFADNGNYVALGMAGGEVYLIVQLYMTQKLYSQILSGHKDDVFSAKFSPDSKMLVTTSADGKIYIWNITDGKILHVLNGNKKLSIPAIFTTDGKSIVSASKKREIIFRDFNGNIQKKIKTPSNIIKFSISKDSRFLYALCEDYSIYLFDILHESELGHIPAFRKNTVLSYAFNADSSKVLVGYEDGTLYLLDTNEVLLKPGLDLDPIKESPSVGKSTPKKTLSDKGAHNIEIRFEMFTVQQYYSFAINPNIGYTNSAVFAPLYFGAILKLDVAFPNSDFPYNYLTDNGYIIYGLDLVGFTVAVPVGIVFAPFPVDINLYLEAQVGFSLYTFFVPNFGLSDYAVPSFTASAHGGLTWRQFSLYAGVSYDLQLGLAFSGGFGMRIQLGKSRVITPKKAEDETKI